MTQDLIVVDSHVHFHVCFDAEKALSSAHRNFQAITKNSADIINLFPCLLLTEMHGENWFTQHSNQVNQSPNKCYQLGRWSLRPTSETHSLLAVDDSGATIALIAGRQIITQEKLEVLSLLTSEIVNDGLSLQETIDQIQEIGGIPVLPWGVGKWIGKRGQIITELLSSQSANQIYLGDNSGRPAGWKYPPNFQLAKRQGITILPGTDPLPITHEANRIGSYGFTVEGSLDWDYPRTNLLAKLNSPDTLITSYGKQENPWQFLKNQISLRLNSKSKKSSKQTVMATEEMMENTPIAKGMTIAGATSRSAATSSNSQFPETADIETSSDDYAARFSGAIGTWLLAIQEQATLNMLRDYPNASVLDVGGGHGQLTPALLSKGYKVTVLGSDESCQNRIHPYVEVGDCQFQVGNVLALPYENNAFDFVISFRFLAHINQWKQFISELARVAKIAVIVDYPTVRSFNSIAPLLFGFKKGVEQNTRPYLSYEEDQLNTYFQSLGLIPAQRYAQFFWPMVLHRMMKSPKLSAFLEGFVRPIGLTRLLGSPVILMSLKEH
jgi:SAM-dependent methyltransferase